MGVRSHSAGNAESPIPSSASGRPLTDWNRLPKLIRTMEALSTGTATKKADCSGVKASCLAMYGASGPSITQAVKPVSK